MGVSTSYAVGNVNCMARWPRLIGSANPRAIRDVNCKFCPVNMLRTMRRCQWWCGDSCIEFFSRCNPLFLWVKEKRLGIACKHHVALWTCCACGLLCLFAFVASTFVLLCVNQIEGLSRRASNCTGCKKQKNVEMFFCPWDNTLDANCSHF